MSKKVGVVFPQGIQCECGITTELNPTGPYNAIWHDEEDIIKNGIEYHLIEFVLSPGYNMVCSCGCNLQYVWMAEKYNPYKNAVLVKENQQAVIAIGNFNIVG